MVTKPRKRFARILHDLRANQQMLDAFMLALLLVAMLLLMQGIGNAIDGVFRNVAPGA